MLGSSLSHTHTLQTHLTVVHSSQELVAAQRKLWPVAVVHPLPSVVQMLEVMRRHCGGKSHISEQSSTSNKPEQAPTCTRSLTLCDTAAEATLEAAASLHELHVGTHVGLAAVAADGPTLAVVHQVGRALKRAETSGPTGPCSSEHAPHARGNEHRQHGQSQANSLNGIGRKQPVILLINRVIGSEECCDFFFSIPLTLKASVMFLLR